MYKTDNRIRIPALAIAMVMGLASTFGLTALLEGASAPADATSVLAARGVPTEVAISPASINVFAVRSREVAFAGNGDTQLADTRGLASEVAIAPVEVVATRKVPAHRHFMSALFGRHAG